MKIGNTLENRYSISEGVIRMQLRNCTDRNIIKEFEFSGGFSYFPFLLSAIIKTV